MVQLLESTMNLNQWQMVESDGNDDYWLLVLCLFGQVLNTWKVETTFGTPQTTALIIDFSLFWTYLHYLNVNKLSIVFHPKAMSNTNSKQLLWWSSRSTNTCPKSGNHTQKHAAKEKPNKCVDTWKSYVPNQKKDHQTCFNVLHPHLLHNMLPSNGIFRDAKVHRTVLLRHLFI